MGWQSYLPDSPERLSLIEGWLYFAIFLFAVLTAIGGYVAFQIRGYRGLLEKREVERQLAKSELDLSATKIELNKARQDADTARKSAEQVRQQLAPRAVSLEQRRAIVDRLRPFQGKLEVLYPADVEAQIFAKRLAAIIREAGWEVTEEGAISFGPLVGLRVEVYDEESAPEYTTALKDALRTVSDRLLFRVNKGVAKGNLRLTVGSKPLDG